MLAEIDEENIKEGPKWSVKENNMGHFWSLGTLGSDYIEQWNKASFVSKVRLWVSVGGFSGCLSPVYAFIFRRLLGEKALTP